jgi:hypothetical protein
VEAFLTSLWFTFSSDSFALLVLIVILRLQVQVMRDVYQEYMDTCHDFYDIYPEERMRDVSRPNYNPNERPPTPEAMKTPPGPPRGYFSPIFPLAYRRIMQVRSHSLL